MSAAHTPTPWVLVEKPTTAGTVFKVGSQQMVDGTHGGICLYDDHTSLNPHVPGTQEANAAFIVRACNSHDQLVAAVKAQHSAIDTLMAHLIHLDPNFKPTKSIIWPAVVAGNEALAAAGAK